MTRFRAGAAGAALLAAMLAPARPARAQEVRVRDVVVADGAVPVRLVGYGLVVGLDGSGDRTSGARGSHTVQSVANLLRRFNVEVPPEVLSTRNVAAVLVTAEVSPYMRPGAHFDVQVASVGDARSLRGGVLWMTPLVAESGGPAFGTAQGSVAASGSGGSGGRRLDDNGSAAVRLPGGGVVEAELPRPAFASLSRLVLREPNLGTAVRVAEAVNGALGAGAATVEDPGSVALKVPAGDAATSLARVLDLKVRPDRVARLVINARDGTVVAGGDMAVGEAVVSHGAITLSVGGAAGPAADGMVRVAAGTPVQDIAAALHAVNAPAVEIAAIFEALREVGALAAEVVVR